MVFHAKNKSNGKPTLARGGGGGGGGGGGVKVLSSHAKNCIRMFIWF